MSQAILHIPLDELMVDPNQPRKVWLHSELDRLAASIAARGVLQPLRVMRDNERKRWRIITGESRYRAARQAGLKTVPCLPIDGQPSEAELLADQIIENHCRNDLRPLDLARALSKLKSLKRCTSADLAAEFGISGASVTRAESLLTLPEDVQAMVDDGRLAESAAYEISRLKDETAIREMVATVASGRMSRDRVTAAVRQKIGKKPGRRRGARKGGAGQVAGTLGGVAFRFSGDELSPESLLMAIEQLAARIRQLQQGGRRDVAALAELLRAS